MARILRFLAVLLPGMALVAWGAFALASRTARAWFEADIAEHSSLVASLAGHDLASRWTPAHAAEVAATLETVARDDHVMAASACLPGGATLAAVPAAPAWLDCQTLLGRITGGEIRRAASVEQLAQGRGYVTVLPVRDAGTTVGALILVYDEARYRQIESRARWAAVLGFFGLAAGLWFVALVAIRVSRRAWLREVRDLLRGEAGHRAEFQPLVQDVRQLVAQLAAESEETRGAGSWTPERLKHTLASHFGDDHIIVVANREPYIHERQPDGSVRVVHPASGLVTALEPVMRACSGVWIAHGSGTADRESSDRRGRLTVPPGEESFVLRRVWLSEEEEKGYYFGFANEGLWPLCHVAHTRPIFRADDWRDYRIVNQRFADAVCDEAGDEDDPVVLVQDYHFALAPRMIRRRLSRATILTFWHIPWPSAERIAMCPWRHDILDGLLGSSILGFHTQLHCNNFIECVDRFLEARIDRERFGVVRDRLRTLVRPYPISIEWPNHYAETVPDAATCRAEVLAELGLPADTSIGIGVDRLDYTKGIEERFLTVERLLERFPEFRRRFVFVQLAAPSRATIEEYRLLNERVEQQAARINDQFATPGWKPIVLLRRHHEPADVFRFYKAADVCYVSSLHDGMNLVAKEFVVAHDDGRGVLILSSFTGASRELTEALVVNPYDLEEASSALATAISMPIDEQRTRMSAMRAYVSHFNVYRWAGRMLIEASHLRERQRISDQLTEWRPVGAMRR